MLRRDTDQTSAANGSLPIWRDPTRSPRERVADLLAKMTLEEKIAQLYGVWVGADASGDGVAPHQHDMSNPDLDWHALISRGIGQLTRPFGTAPVDPALGARALARTQAEIVAANRHGVPALVHEECLTGFMTWGATTYPTPLAWGASFDPALVEEMGRQIGTAMRRMGVHQGLAPVLDVVRDYRWGRVEETIGEDPYLVGTIGSAYVKGLESAGIVATLKHFVAYSGSRAGRNFAPVATGPRELADVFLLPFEMALRLGGARSVMHSYNEIDGVPVAANADLLTNLLRDQWDFHGTVVSDYFGIAFLRRLHQVAEDDTGAAVLALTAGIDVELPTVHCYGEPLTQAVRAGLVSEELIDRAVCRVLEQKCELGLLDPDWTPEPAAVRELGHHAETDADDARGTINLDPPESRALARRLAEESVVLLANTGVLPISNVRRMAVVGPLADDPAAMLGCYTFESHVRSAHPQVPPGIDIPSVLEALRAEFPETKIEHARGCDVRNDDRSGFPEAVALAESADLCVIVVGDRSGLFGRGTSGEGSDVPDLRLPGVQEEFIHRICDAGTPAVLVLLTGRPYALGGLADRVQAIVQAFFPGEEGGSAIAGILSGRVSPSGRLPVSIPRHPGGQPGTYLTPRLGQRSDVSSVDPTPLWPFGYGLSYTSFAWDDVRLDGVPINEPVERPVDSVVELSLRVTNTGHRLGTDVVQLYLHDPIAQVTRPTVQLIGYARVTVAAGESRRVTFRIPTDVFGFTGRDGHRIVEPGEIELRLSESSNCPRFSVPVRLVGVVRRLGPDRALVTTVQVSEPVAAAGRHHGEGLAE